MNFHRPTTWLVATMSLFLASAPALAQQTEQLAGILSTIDVEGKKLAVMPTGKEKTVDVTVNDQTVIETSAGKGIALKDLKSGDGLGIAHTAGLASKIIVNIKPAELVGHVKSVGANLKTFVVTETGTNTDLTVVITAETSIITTEGKKIELKELKKGDGVGISHLSSVASKVIVNVKPVE